MYSSGLVRSLFLSITFTIAGCGDPYRAPPAGMHDPLPLEAYPRITALEGLSPWLLFEEPIVDASTADRPLRVTVPVRLGYDRPRDVQYAYQFFDANGRLLVERQWRFVHLEPRTVFHFEGSALETSAVDWRLEVRPAR